MKIPLTQNKFAIIDDEDYTKELTTIVCGEKVTARICDRKWYAWSGYGSYYAVTKIRLKNGERGMLRLHRLILGIPPDPKLQCDHINRDSLNNKRENLRWVTGSQNQANTKKRRDGITSNYIGVCWFRRTKKWRSTIRFGKRKVHIGCFDNEVDAAIAYDKKKIELYGVEYSNLNFPDEYNY